VSGLKGLYEARLVLPGDSYKVSLSILWRDPPLKHHPTSVGHGESIAVPGRLGGVAGQGAVGAVIVDELFEVSEKVHSHGTSSSVSNTDQPSFKIGRNVETTASLDSSPVYSKKRSFRCPPLPFAAVEHDPDITPVLKLPT
jgi:hypothetical protein